MPHIFNARIFPSFHLDDIKETHLTKYGTTEQRNKAIHNTIIFIHKAMHPIKLEADKKKDVLKNKLVGLLNQQLSSLEESYAKGSDVPDLSRRILFQLNLFFYKHFSDIEWGELIAKINEVEKIVYKKPYKYPRGYVVNLSDRTTYVWADTSKLDHHFLSIVKIKTSNMTQFTLENPSLTALDILRGLAFEIDKFKKTYPSSTLALYEDLIGKIKKEDTDKGKMDLLGFFQKKQKPHETERLLHASKKEDEGITQDQVSLESRSSVFGLANTL